MKTIEKWRILEWFEKKGAWCGACISELEAEKFLDSLGVSNSATMLEMKEYCKGEKDCYGCKMGELERNICPETNALELWEIDEISRIIAEKNDKKMFDNG